MGLSFLCLLYLVVQYVGVLARIEYNTHPTPRLTIKRPYQPEVISKTCLLEPQEGPCRGNIRMYYYDPEKKNCSTFRWGGCQGNGNRFDKRSDCVNTCLSKENAPINRPRYCSLSFDYGFCFGALKRYYYDRYWKVCKETVYSGCGGNKNNFYSFEQCDTICRLGKSMLRIPTPGPGAEKVRKKLIINPYNTTPKRGKAQGDSSKKTQRTKKTPQHTETKRTPRIASTVSGNVRIVTSEHFHTFFS